MKKNLVILSGAGMSAESGISTFRDAGGLWDKYPVMQVASAEGYVRDPELVINFYNERRKQLLYRACHLCCYRRTDGIFTLQCIPGKCVHGRYRISGAWWICSRCGLYAADASVYTDRGIDLSG